MNKTLIEDDGMTTINNILKQLGEWPVLEGNNWNESEFDWKTSVYKFRKLGYGFSHFIGFSIMSDVKNSTNRVIYVSTECFFSDNF